MIKISKSWIEKKDQHVYLMTTVEIPDEAIETWKKFTKKCDAYTYLKEDYTIENNKITLWYQVEEKYGSYFSLDRNDGFLIGMLYYAMATGQDIVSELPISSKLLFTLNYIVIPIFCSRYTDFKRIFIKADGIDTPCECLQKVGAGMSCGIDSLYTVHSLQENYINKEYQLTCLTFIDTGASHYLPHIPVTASLEEINKEADKIHQEKMKKAKEVAKELQMDFMEIRSNISDIYQGMFSQSHAYRNIGAVLALQKYFGKYYYSSSGYPITEFNPSLYLDPAHGEQVLIPSLSTDGLELICSGEARTRYIKTEELADDKIAQKYLNVCSLDENCGHCSKCYRTMLLLDVLGKLEEFKEVFDIEDYKRHKTKAYLWLMKNKKGDHFAREIYVNARKKKMIPIPTLILGEIYYLIVKIKRAL